MVDHLRAIAFDVDAVSVTSLRHAFPEWDIVTTAGATVLSLEKDWRPSTADLLIVGQHARLTETLGLCRALRSQVGQAHTPILVLVTTADEDLVRAALDAGADSCLVLPIHHKELVDLMTRARVGNRPGRHTLNLDQAQRLDPWQDDGGES